MILDRVDAGHHLPDEFNLIKDLDSGAWAENNNSGWGGLEEPGLRLCRVWSVTADRVKLGDCSRPAFSASRFFSRDCVDANIA